MTEDIDMLSEACKIAGIVASEEVELAELEKQIADKIRSICLTIFNGDTKFRMDSHTVGRIPGEFSGVKIWTDIEVERVNNVRYDNGCNAYGDRLMLRIRTNGEIIAVFEDIKDDNDAPYRVVEEYFNNNRTWTYAPATDHQIATSAVTLSRGLLAALRRRIDTAKEEKAELLRISGL